MKMSEDELIEMYVIDNYTFTSNIDGWCISDRITGKKIILQRLITDIEKVFPDYDIPKFCSMWWAKNITILNQKVCTHLCNYHLKMSNRAKVWVVVNSFGKELNFDDIMKLVPSHHNKAAIMKLYDEWFEDELHKETKRLIKNI